MKKYKKIRPKIIEKAPKGEEKREKIREKKWGKKTKQNEEE